MSVEIKILIDQEADVWQLGADDKYYLAGGSEPRTREEVEADFGIAAEVTLHLEESEGGEIEVSGALT